MRKGRVLIIEHVEDHLKTLLVNVNMLGCDAHWCNKGHAALSNSLSWQPDVIIMNDQMEGMRAWKFAQRLLACKTFVTRPYLVALASFPSKLQEALCFENGFDEYVKKPIQLSQLADWCSRAGSCAMREHG